jgi:integrase
MPHTEGIRTHAHRCTFVRTCAREREAALAARSVKTLRAATRTDAKVERDSFLTQLRRGEVPAPSRITFREVAEEYLSSVEALVASGERAERTYERYGHALRHHVLPVMGHRSIQKVTADHVAELFTAARKGGLAPWTIKGIQTPLRRVFALAVRRGYLSDNPMLRLSPEELPKGKAKHPPRTLTRPEIHRLLDAAPARYRPLIAVAVLAGLRIQEILGLCWGDIDFKGGVIRVRKQLTRGTKDKPARLVDLKTKSGSRDVVLLEELATLLQVHLRQTAEKRGIPRAESFVFASSEGAAQVTSSVRALIRTSLAPAWTCPAVGDSRHLRPRVRGGARS